jgi:hypothetical protein
MNPQVDAPEPLGRSNLALKADAPHSAQGVDDVAAASRELVVVAVLAAFTVASYLAWLGWDQKKTCVPGTFDSEGPYESWQVIGLAATLELLSLTAPRSARRSASRALSAPASGGRPFQRVRA